MSFSREVIITVADKKGSEVLQIEMNPAELTVEQLKRKVMKKTNIEDIRQVNLTFSGGELEKKEKTLFECGVKDDVNFAFSDTGKLIGKQMGCILGYLPPLIVYTFLYLTTPNLTALQRNAYLLGCMHYSKRIYEAFFVHNFSDAALPLKDVIIIAFAYYTGIQALGAGLPLRSPDHDRSTFSVYFWTIAVLIFEFLNFMAHVTQKNLREPTKQDLEDIKSGKITMETVKTRRKIPYGWGFDYVSSANYLWEIGSWFSYAMLTRLTFAWIFAFLTLGILIDWGSKRHQKYKKDFDGKDGRELYPKERKALIPFVF